MNNQENPLRSPEELPPGELLMMVYDELRRLASSRMVEQGGVQTLQPTALVHEAWLKVTSKDGSNWRDRTHFFRAAAVAMRCILVDRARAKSTLKREGVRVDLSFASQIPSELGPEDQIVIMDECLEQMAKDHPDCAKVVQLKFFAGLSNEETATLLGSSLRSVERQWAFARSKLYQMIRNRERAMASET